MLPLILDSTRSIVSREVVCQDDSQQLKSDRVVFAICIGAIKSFIYEAMGQRNKKLYTRSLIRYICTVLKLINLGHLKLLTFMHQCVRKTA